MKAQRLFQVLGLLDEDLIDEAWTYVPEKKASLLRRSPWLQGAAVAACCVVMCTFGFFYLVTGGFRGMGSTAPGNRCTGNRRRQCRCGEFLWKQRLNSGLFVLCRTGAASDHAGKRHGLTAQRSLTWDFAPGSYDDGSPRQWGALVTDDYTLTTHGPATSPSPRCTLSQAALQTWAP